MHAVDVDDRRAIQHDAAVVAGRRADGIDERAAVRDVGRGLRDRDAKRRANGKTVAAVGFGITKFTSAGEPDDGNVVNVCVELPIVPVLVLASVTCSVRLLAPVFELRRSQSGTAMLPPGSVTRQAPASASTSRPTGAPNATVTAASVPGGLRDNATAGVLRRYRGFEPDDGNRRRRHDAAVGAAGAAPGPPGFAIVAVLSIGVIGGVPAAMRASNTIAALPFAGTAMFATLTRPVPFAPVPAPVEASTAPAGMLTTASVAELCGKIVDDARRRRGDAGRLDERDRVAHRVAGLGLAAVQVDDRLRRRREIRPDDDRRVRRRVVRGVRRRSSRSTPTAVLTTLGTAAPVAATVNAIGGSELPESSVGGCVQVTTCAAAPHDQPVPTPLTYVRPAGNVSVTTTALSSRCQPAAFATVNV